MPKLAEGYTAKYGFQCLEKNVTRFEAEHALQISPEPLVVEDINQYIVMANREHNFLYLCFYLHHIERILNGRIYRFFHREGLYAYDPVRLLDYKLNCVSAIVDCCPGYDPDKGADFLTYAYYVLRKLPFLPSFQIPNLSAASVPLISGSITAAVFCCSGIDGQKPAPAGSALLGSVSYTQSFIQIRAEHTHERNIDHVLCDYRRIAVRPQQRRVLGGGVSHCHPGGIVLEFFNLREALPKESSNVLGRSLESGIVQLLRKGKHGLLILLQRISQLRQHRQRPKQGFALFVFRIR